MTAGRLFTPTLVDQGLLTMAGLCPMTTPAFVKRLWPESKQPEIKQRTLERKLRRLQRAGLLDEVQGVWFRAGQTAPTIQPKEPTRPRLQLVH